MSSTDDTRKQRRPTRRRAIQRTSTKHTSAIGSQSDDDVYFVHKIVDEMESNGQTFFKVRWQGFSASEDTWEPEKNLSSVTELIAYFRKMKEVTGCTSGPIPTPSTSRFHAGIKRRGGTVPQTLELDSGKRRLISRSRISGRFEYVPKNELVAHKTKFFNDLSDGKIDLTRDDLYSRVKTRRRPAENLSSTGNDSQPSTNNSLIDSEHDGDTASEQNSLIFRHESHSPLTEHITETFTDSIPPAVVAGENIDPFQMGIFKSLEPFDSSDALVPSCEQAVQVNTITMDASTSLASEMVDAALSPIIILDTEATSERSAPSPIFPKEISSRLSVSSASELITHYFSIVAGAIQNMDHMNRPVISSVPLASCSIEGLPEIIPYFPLTGLRSIQEVVNAIEQKRWYLLMNIPSLRLSNRSAGSSSIIRSSDDEFPYFEELFCQHAVALSMNITPTRSLEDLAHITIRHAGPSCYLERLLQLGLDPNAIVVSDLKWPLLALSVFMNNIQLSQLLLDAGADPDCTQDYFPGRTALGVAITLGHMNMVSMLLLSGVNFYEVESGVTALSLLSKLITAEQIRPTPRRNIDHPGVRLQHLPEPPIPALPSGSGVEQNLPGELANNPNNVEPNGDLNSRSDDTQSLSYLQIFRDMYSLISVHHAHLISSITKLTQNWFNTNKLVQKTVVYPCRWTSIRKRVLKFSFSWPIQELCQDAQLTNSNRAVPILFLVHGRIIPPTCYDLWMDVERGPCWIANVLLDNQPQKPLERDMFVSTLYPITWPPTGAPQEHHVTINFSEKHIRTGINVRQPCVAVFILTVSPKEATG